MDKSHEPQYVTAVGLNDVQLGRGRPVVTSEGNQRFRALILQYKLEYSASNRHAHKDSVARKILTIITERGGKFLRKIESSVERTNFVLEDGKDLWEIANEVISVNKVKQALRENESSAPSSDAATGRPFTTAKAKKDGITQYSEPRVKSRKRVVDSLSGKINPESLKRPQQKKKRERQAAIPTSLAESIRLNASKLGTDYSFADSSYPPLYSNVLDATPPVIENDIFGSADNTIAQSTFLNRGDQSLSIYMASASGHAGDDQKLRNKYSEFESTNQCENHSIVAESIAESDTNVNNAIQAHFTPSDSRQKNVPVVHDSVVENIQSEKEGASSDDDKKPAAN